MVKLFLIPTTLSNTGYRAVLPSFQLDMVLRLEYFIVETAKVARRHLKCLNLIKPLQELHIQELGKSRCDYEELIKPLLSGNDMGLLSDCGFPAIADPGSQVVKLAHKYGVKVVPLVGPNSFIIALASSGVNGQSFAFVGYLPVEFANRYKAILQLQEKVLKYQQSQIIIETPFRSQKLFIDLVNILDKDIVLCVAINLMQDDESIISCTVGDWVRKNSQLNLNKKEVVFVIGV